MSGFRHRPIGYFYSSPWPKGQLPGDCRCRNKPRRLSILGDRVKETQRGLFARIGTFIDFIRQQRRISPGLTDQLTPLDPNAQLLIDGSEKGWTPGPLTVQRGENFRVVASGYQWLARPLGLVIEPRSTIYMRIGGRDVRKLVADDAVYTAWGDGRLEFLTKGLSEFADEDGNLLPGKRKLQGPGIGINVALAKTAPTPDPTPQGWRHLWRLGDGRIYSGESNDIRVCTHGDVGILQRRVDLPLTQASQLSWEWLVEQLPSALPEDLAFTHDYLSIAVEFDNGRDLTYMWSSALPQGLVFRCPLDWWCERETHWVLRSGAAGLGQWHGETRNIAADYQEALGDDLPRKIERVWLIANSVFQRNHGVAQFRNISVK